MGVDDPSEITTARIKPIPAGFVAYKRCDERVLYTGFSAIDALDATIDYVDFDISNVMSARMDKALQKQRELENAERLSDAFDELTEREVGVKYGAVPESARTLPGGFEVSPATARVYDALPAAGSSLTYEELRSNVERMAGENVSIGCELRELVKIDQVYIDAQGGCARLPNN